MRRTCYRLAVLGAFAAAIATAQTTVSVATAARTPGASRQAASRSAVAVTPAGGPTLGYVFDTATSTVRRVAGVAGLASVDDAIGADLAARAAFSSPQQDYVLAIARDDGRVAIFRTERGAFAGSSYLDAVKPAPDRIVFSPSGNSALLYYAADARAVALKHLPLEPEVAGSWDLPAGYSVASLAVDDAGTLALASAKADSAASVWLLPAGQLARAILPLSDPSALSFFWGSTDALVADRAKNEIYLLHDPAGAAATTILAGESQGVVHPSTLAISSDGRVAAVLSSDSSAVLVLDVAARDAVASLSCACTPTGLTPLAGSYSFQVTALSGGRFLALDADPAAPRLYSIGESPGSRRKADGGRTRPVFGAPAGGFAVGESGGTSASASQTAGRQQ